MFVLNMSTGKGTKRLRNQPVFYDEMKKRRCVWLTDSSWLFLQENAVKSNKTTSEYLEGIIRKINSTDSTEVLS